MRAHLQHAIAHLVEREILSLSSIAAAFHVDDPRFHEGADLDTLVDLGTRLPSGLVHAESILIFSEAPAELEPLAPDSAWYALDRSIAVVLPLGRRALHRLLRDLALYFFCARRVGERLEDRSDIIDALANEALEPSRSTELALLLDAAPSLVASLHQRAPGLLRDLATMANTAFDPDLRLHASLRPERQRALGVRVADSLLARLPHGPFRLLVADTPMVLEHLSPYVRDLGHALTTWGLENRERLKTDGLVEALEGNREQPNVDLAAIVIPDLLAMAPDLLHERRSQEEEAGLFVEDEAGMVHGWADFARLAAPDDLAVGKDASGLVAVLSGTSDEALQEATRCLLDSGRVAALSAVMASSVEGGEPLVPEALASDHDGIRIPLAEDVVERSVKLGLSVHRGSCLPIDDASGAPLITADLLGEVRRARVLGRFGEDAPAFVVLYPRPSATRSPDLTHRLGEVEAGRIALSYLSSPDDPHAAARPKRVLSQNGPGLSRRFRA
jgi:hypothetical protein